MLGGGGGDWDKAPEMMLLSWQLAASTDFSFMNTSTRPSFAEAYLGDEDTPSRCGGPPFLSLLVCKPWHRHTKDPHDNNLQCRVHALCHGGAPCRGWGGDPIKVE